MEKVSPGDPFQFAARDYNRLADLANSATPPSPPKDYAERNPVIVNILNDTEEALGRHYVVGLGDSVVDLATRPHEWRNSIVIKGETPTTADHTGKFAVLLESCPVGGRADAVILGVVQVLLDVTAESDKYADVYDEDTTKLKTGASGSARILWKESGTGEKLGIVELTGATPPVTGVRFLNDSGTYCTPHACMEIKDCVVDDGEVYYKIGLPSGRRDSQLWLINGATGVADGDYGRAVWATEATSVNCYYDESTPQISELWIPAEGEWYLTPVLGSGTAGVMCGGFRPAVYDVSDYTHGAEMITEWDGAGGTSGTYWTRDDDDENPFYTTRKFIQTVEPEIPVVKMNCTLSGVLDSGNTVRLALSGASEEVWLSHRVGVKALPSADGTLKITRTGLYRFHVRVTYQATAGDGSWHTYPTYAMVMPLLYVHAYAAGGSGSPGEVPTMWMATPICPCIGDRLDWTTPTDRIAECTVVGRFLADTDIEINIAVEGVGGWLQNGTVGVGSVLIAIEKLGTMNDGYRA